MTHVVDASVLLAYFLGEPGGDVLSQRDRLYQMSIINLAEVFTKAIERGAMVDDVTTCVNDLQIRIRAFGEDQAIEQARLRPLTAHLGLSFGDRACLALARQADMPVLTADRKWSDLDIGIDIIQIR